jgi:hypothetical protein
MIYYGKRVLVVGASVFIIALIMARSYKNTEWDSPFFIGEYDEVYTINSSINVFYNYGDPHDYLYGGVSVYPQSLIFFIYDKFTGKKPYFRGAYERPLHGAPEMRRIYPVRPIYIGRKLVLAIYAVMIVLLFLLIARISKSYLISGLFGFMLFRDNMLQHFSIVIKPEIYTALFTALSFLAFVEIIRKREQKYFIWQSVFCGLAIGTKLTCLPLISLLFFSSYVLSSVKRESFISEFKKLVIKGIIISAAVFLVTNIGIIIHPHHYFKLLFQESGRFSGLTSIPWQQNILILFEWLKQVQSTFFQFKYMNNLLLLFLAVFSVIWFFCTNRLLFFGTFSFVALSILWNLNIGKQLYPRLFIHLNPVFYFIILFPIAETLNRGWDKIKGNFQRFAFFNYYMFDKIIFLILLVNFSFTNISLLENYTKPYEVMPEVMGDSRIALLNYIKDNPTKKFAMFNYHYYSMPEEFYTFKNISYFEKVMELNKIVRNKEAQYLVYFQENGGYGKYLESQAIDNHKSAMRRFDRYPKMFEIKGNDSNVFGDQGPQVNPTVIIRRIDKLTIVERKAVQEPEKLV